MVGGLVNQPAAFIAVKGAVTFTSIYAAEALWRQHHRAAAILLDDRIDLGDGRRGRAQQRNAAIGSLIGRLTRERRGRQPLLDCGRVFLSGGRNTPSCIRLRRCRPDRRGAANDLRGMSHPDSSVAGLWMQVAPPETARLGVYLALLLF